MRYQDDKIIISAYELANYVLDKDNDKIRALFPSVISDYCEFDTDKKQHCFEYDYNGIKLCFTYEIYGADDGSIFMISKYRKSPYRDIRSLFSYFLSAYFHLKLNYLDRINLIVTNKETCYSFDLSGNLLEKVFETVINRASFFIEFYNNYNHELTTKVKSLQFPFSTIRDTQYSFIQSVHKAIKKEKSIMISAPTGTGKTISALYPSIRGIADGNAEKVFYFTDKTITGRIALDSFKALISGCMNVKAIHLLSKEQLCINKDNSSGFKKELCKNCDYILSHNGITYKEREINAIRSVLSSTGPIIGKEEIIATASQYNVCPYELALDTSEFCTMVVLDYNYILDDRIRIRRYFSDGIDLDCYIFLFDEAHNLPNRIRNIYSGIFDSSIVSMLERVFDSYEKNEVLSDVIIKTGELLSFVKELCSDNTSLTVINQKETEYGYYTDSIISERIKSEISIIYSKIKEFEKAVDPGASEELSEIIKYFDAFIHSCETFTEGNRVLAESLDGTVSYKVICVDTSSIIQQIIKRVRTAVFYSATFFPFEYFKKMLGIDTVIELDSVFDSSNQKVVVVDSISTRFSDRDETLSSCSRVISETITKKPGNYIVYCSSFSYMNKLLKSFLKLKTECSIVVQKENMTFSEKQKFLNIFKNGNHKNVVGFCVLGGMFSEGIDLAGNNLIGTIIFGTGEVVPSSERNLMAEYFEEKYENGKNYAYIYPGINKVIQAAGRVIRTESDRGVIVLVDDRFRDPNINGIFPDYWKNIDYVSSFKALNTVLKNFWNEN